MLRNWNLQEPKAHNIHEENIILLTLNKINATHKREYFFEHMDTSLL
jgi:hypothetical protein